MSNTDEGYEERVKILKLRDDYQRIIEETNQKIQGNGNIPAEELRNILVKSNSLFEEVKSLPKKKQCSESCLDAQLLKVVASLGKANIENTQANFLTFRPVEFATNLVNYANNKLKHDQQDDSDYEDDEDYKISEQQLVRLGRSIQNIYLSSAGLKPLYGALDWEPPEKQKKERIVQEKAEKRMVTLEKEKVVTMEDNKSESEISVLYHILSKRFQQNNSKPIMYLKFIIDPDSFSRTIENMFHVSFLIRDHFATITLDANKVPVIAPLKRTFNEAGTSDDSKRQGIIELNYKFYKETIELLKIKQAMIPAKHNRGVKRSQ